MLWTYADKQADGSYKRIGGGPYDEATDTYGQGAFNADDMARAAVVYLRHWKQTKDPDSRTRAFEMLRGLTYLQTVSGKNAGNVVLWMQPDGTLNRSAEPVELPDPSDSDASYWLARTIWALGEGYAAFKNADPAFARFLERRLALAVDAVDRQVLDSYGRYLNIDGRRTPAWLIADGADASAEAVLGLASYVRAGGTGKARRAMTRLSDGIAQLAGGNARTWPFGGVLPWALSRSDWHAWGSQMTASLARAADATGDRSWRRVARARGVHLRPVDAHLGRSRQRPPAGPGGRHADRLRRGLPGPEPPCDRRRCPPARRSRGRVVLRGERLQGADLRPRDRHHLRRCRPGRQGEPELGSGVHDPRAAHDDRPRRRPDGEADRDDRSGAAGRGHGVRPGRGQPARGRRHGREAEVDLDRRVPVRRHRLCRARRRGHRDLRPR